MAYSKNAPEGYTFVPLGTRDLTEYCKEQCRAKDLVAHIVSVNYAMEYHSTYLTTTLG
jgi:hypothetical protein